jgi:hypothetical protein
MNQNRILLRSLVDHLRDCFLKCNIVKIVILLFEDWQIQRQNTFFFLYKRCQSYIFFYRFTQFLDNGWIVKIRVIIRLNYSVSSYFYTFRSTFITKLYYLYLERYIAMICWCLLLLFVNGVVVCNICVLPCNIFPVMIESFGKFVGNIVGSLDLYCLIGDAFLSAFEHVFFCEVHFYYL